MNEGINLVLFHLMAFALYFFFLHGVIKFLFFYLLEPFYVRLQIAFLGFVACQVSVQINPFYRSFSLCGFCSVFCSMLYASVDKVYAPLDNLK